MPSRPGRPCSQPGCWRLVIGSQSRCSEHKRQPWSRTTPRRVPSGNGWAWQRLRARILQRDNHRCVYCGAVAEVVDHVIGIAVGGSDQQSNLVAACQACNERKRVQEARAARSKATKTKGERP